MREFDNLLDIPNPLEDRGIAPNGNSVRDNFLQWQSGNQCLDSDGLPFAVYHGASVPIDAFDPARLGSKHVDLEAGDAFYFTNCIDTAMWYASDSAKQDGKKPGEGHVHAVYLHIRNPKRVDFQGTGVEYLGEEIESAKQAGYDGLVCQDYDDGTVSDHYIVFKPEQIKSAFGQSGNYSSSASLSDGGQDHTLTVKQVKDLIKAHKAKKAAEKAAFRDTCKPA